ncbi:baseplate J/gp47 family protein [Geoalkalibacter halelectricus]|uniref:Baseplate J/gp47 family protein n=1 Tax=Geoalkalibacter halelectricus TaxID=2847045 RepID=A0ABY5ZSN9_9BACT|nr:baseplate J/gp47 family protein [Geoalkalibacter halelectricus]MDO3379160.1 baseplate J/gp47 family protein [Geoalkalibacter halelectricus]UWZ80920.1 baseplate J/gp47 family protein [Geoalkalibacter halelectricus]
MNGDTRNLIERPYQEIVDDILTAVVGGVVNEPIIFDVKEDLYPLAEPAREIRGITGTRARARHSFHKEIDFLFSEGDNAVVWQPGGQRPDDETTFYVDYFRRESDSPLTDINVGSVTRTLSEAIGREIATVYQQINQAYLSAFIETAEGTSLDLVVAILGVVRHTRDHAVGLATFFRDPDVEGNITIPEGVVLTTEKGEASFITTQQRTLQRGQVRIDVPIRAGEDFKGEAGKVEAGKITTLAAPIAGIARVTNFEATFLGAKDESDEELRARARAVLRALGKGTLAALARVIFEGRGELVEYWDPSGPPAKQSPLGTVTLLVEAEPERFPSLQAAVHETRAAGVLATLVARYVFFKPRVRARIAAGLTAAGKDKVKGEIIAAAQAYVDGLTAGEPAEGGELLAAIQSPKEVSDALIVDVMAWRSDLAAPGGESLSDALTAAVSGLPSGDPDALRAAIDQILDQRAPAPPGGRRIPDRSLVQDAAGERAADEDIEAGEFFVAAQVLGEDWWVVLDFEPADIVLEEG